ELLERDNLFFRGDLAEPFRGGFVNRLVLEKGVSGLVALRGRSDIAVGFEAEAEIHRWVDESGDRLERDAEALQRLVETECHLEVIGVNLQPIELVLENNRYLFRIGHPEMIRDGHTRVGTSEGEVEMMIVGKPVFCDH